MKRKKTFEKCLFVEMLKLLSNKQKSCLTGKKYTCFVCLFVWSLSSHSRIFHSYRDVTIASEGLKIWNYARHSWPLSSEGSLTCHTFCDTGLPFIMVISKDPWHSHLLPSIWQWSCHYLFLRLRSVVTGDRTPISWCEANTLPLRHLGGKNYMYEISWDNTPIKYFKLYMN